MKNIKPLLLTFLMLSVFALFSQETKTWETNYETALLKAEKENKLILMNFSGSDWCANCIRLEKAVFTTDTFLNYSKDKFVLLRLDFPQRSKNKLSEEQTKHNEALAEKFNPEGEFPLVIILNTSGKPIGKTGYVDGGAETFIKTIEKIIKQ